MKRCRHDIFQSLLMAADEKKDGAGKTALVYKAGLNFRVINDYLDTLLVKDMLTRIDTEEGVRYFTTPIGRGFVRTYESLKRLEGHHVT